MRCICLFLLTLFYYTGWSQTKAENKIDALGKKQGYWEKTDPETKKLIYKGIFKDDKPQGLFVYYYKGTDSIHSKSDFRQDGKIAYVQLFHFNGKLQAKGKYVNEQKDSVWNFYDEAGILLSTEAYLNGKKHGNSKVYTTDGKLTEEKNFVNGVEDGPFKQYFDGVKVKGEGKYKKGQFDGLCAWYFPGGAAAAKGLYENGIKKGVWIYRGSDGKLKEREVWINGNQLDPKQMDEYFKKNKIPGEGTGDIKQNTGNSKAGTTQKGTKK